MAQSVQDPAASLDDPKQASLESTRPKAVTFKETLSDCRNKVRSLVALWVITISVAFLIALGWLPAGGHASPPAMLWWEAAVLMTVTLGICGTWFLGFYVARRLRDSLKPSAEASMAEPKFDGASRRLLHYGIVEWLVRRGAVALPLLCFPALVFAYAMRDSYNPAVFVMALVAIFVAVEHFSSIEEATHKLDETQGALVRARKALEVELKQNQERLGTLLNIDGVEKWRQEVYGSYWVAKKRIDAVIRLLDIDTKWIEKAGNWDAYQASEKDDANKITLFLALITCGERVGRAKVKLAEKQTPRTDRVQFVVDMPSPPFDEQNSEQEIRLFEKLLGLTWWLVVVDRVRLDRRGKGSEPDAFVAINVASSASWMHAVDNDIYQVIEHEGETASARELTRDLSDELRRDRLSQWAHDDVRGVGRRGCDAQEYVCSVLRFAALLGDAPVFENDEWTDEVIIIVLIKLGMMKYLKEPPMPLAGYDDVYKEQLKKWSEERPRLQNLCVQVFRDFINMCPLIDRTNSLRISPRKVSDLLSVLA